MGLHRDHFVCTTSSTGNKKHTAKLNSTQLLLASIGISKHYFQFPAKQNAQRGQKLLTIEHSFLLPLSCHYLPCDRYNTGSKAISCNSNSDFPAARSGAELSDNIVEVIKKNTRFQYQRSLAARSDIYRVDQERFKAESPR
jgi:hypothetical protein